MKERKSKFHPFRDRRHMMLAALQDALAWEESRVEASVHLNVYMGKSDGTEERIKAYRKELERIDPGCKTYSEARDEELSKGTLVCVTELFKRGKKNGRFRKKRRTKNN